VVWFSRAYHLYILTITYSNSKTMIFLTSILFWAIKS